MESTETIFISDIYCILFVRIRRSFFVVVKK